MLQSLFPGFAGAYGMEYFIVYHDFLLAPIFSDAFASGYAYDKHSASSMTVNGLTELLGRVTAVPA